MTQTATADAHTCTGTRNCENQPCPLDAATGGAWCDHDEATIADDGMAMTCDDCGAVCELDESIFG